MISLFSLLKRKTKALLIGLHRNLSSIK